MSQQRDYDCIVIGAGVQGSLTAYQLAKNNQKTLLLEQVSHSVCLLGTGINYHDIIPYKKQEQYAYN